MATEVVQFRFDPAGLAFLQEQGLNPNQVAREAFAGTLRRMQAEARLERIQELTRGAALSRPAEDIIREMRDERAAELERRLS